MRFNRMILWTLLLTLLVLPVTGLAESMHKEVPYDALAMDVTVGYDGLMTYGRTMPIQIRIENKGDDLQGMLAVNIYASRTQYNRYELELTLASGAVKELLLPVRVGSKQETYTVEVWRGDEKIYAVNAVPDKLANPSSMLVGVLSQQPQRLAYMNVDMESDMLLRGDYIQTVPLTEKSFPDRMELLNAFGMIVVDGFDVSLLSAQQQELLLRWLTDGHILLVGGGAQAGTIWPYFADMTDLAPGAMSQHADITPALMSWLGVTGDAAGTDLMLTDSASGNALVTDGETPLIWRSNVGSGVLYTTAFDLGDQALMGWSGMRTFWQRLLIKDCYGLYQQGFDVNRSSGSYTYIASRIPLNNDVNMLLPVLVVMALVLVGGAAAYVVLKRMDRRQLLWLALPLLAVAGTVMVYVMTLTSPAIQPTALTVSVLQQDAEGTKTLQTSLVVATSERGEQLVSVDEGELLPGSSDSWYGDYDDGTKRKEPTILQYRYVRSQTNGIGVPFDAPWETKTFRIESLTTPDGSVDGAVWMDDDGLHGYIVNGTAMTLDRGIFLCKYGFCAVPELAPGQRYDLTLQKAEFPTKNNYVFKDGYMYESMAGSSLQTYTMVDEFFFKTSEQKEGESVPYDSIERNMANLVNSVVDKTYYGTNGYTYYMPRFHYVTFTDDLNLTTLRLNGDVMERTAHRAVVSVEVPFKDVSESGRVYRVPGMDRAVRCQLDSDGEPYYNPNATTSTGDYHRLSECPIFMFEVGDLSRTVIERLAFYVEYMPNQASALLYDGSEWITYTMGEDVNDPQRFVQEDGRIYIQFRPLSGANDYYEVYTPSMLLEGRME